MTKFEDQLFDDLMREHGPSLADATRPARPGRHRRALTLSAAGAGLAAAGIVAGTLATGGGTPAYAVTKNPDGTISVAVHQPSGITGANARLRQLGARQVVVVPARSGCPQLAPPAQPPGSSTVEVTISHGGTATVDARGLPADAIVVIGIVATGPDSMAVSGVTSAPAPACIALPPAPPAAG